MEISEVIQGWRMTGQNDLYLDVIARDIYHLDTILGKLSKIGRTCSSVTLEYHDKQIVSLVSEK